MADVLIRLLIIDGLDALAPELETHLGAQEDIEIVRIADSAIAAIEQPEAVRPDVILMDFLVMGGTGAAAAKLVHARYPEAAMVLLCGEPPENWYFAQFAGVTAYLPITSSSAAVVDTVRKAARNKTPAPPLRSGSGASRPSLSARELQLLQLISMGLTSRAIATEMGLSLNTTRTYTQRLIEKLGTHSKTEAVRKAIQMGLIKP